MGVCMRWWILIKYSMSLCQREGLLMLFILRRLTEKFKTRNKKLFFIFFDLDGKGF